MRYMSRLTRTTFPAAPFCPNTVSIGASFARVFSTVFPVALGLNFGGLLPPFLLGLGSDSRGRRCPVGIALTIISRFVGCLFGIHKHHLYSLRGRRPWGGIHIFFTSSLPPGRET